jgi:hypothetical protein
MKEQRLDMGWKAGTEILDCMLGFLILLQCPEWLWDSASSYPTDNKEFIPWKLSWPFTYIKY